MAKKVKETVPFWLAVAITAVVPLPLALYLGKFNFPLWCSFIVWAQYFVYGSKPSAFKTIFPAFAGGAFWSTVGMVLTALLASALPFFPALVIGFGVAIAAMVYVMRWVPVFREGSLSYFNGVAMMLAVYFTQSYPALTSSPVLMPIIAGIWAILVGWFGAILGWFNVTITFPKEVEE